MPKQKARILVGGEDSSLSVLEAALLPLDYEITMDQAHSADELLARIKQDSPQVILLDISASGADVVELIKRLKRDERGKVIPIGLMTAPEEVEMRLKALEAGADDFLTKPWDRAELRARVNSLLKVSAYNLGLGSYQKEMETEVAKRTESLKQAFEKVKQASLDTIFRLARAAEYKDEDTGAHVQRMSHYCTATARKMGMSEEFVECILFASPMHDVGKIGIPDNILMKPGKLDPGDWEIMRRHTTIGVQILKDSSVEYMKMAEVIALTHHEKWDGSGYPQKLKGADIPLPGRIVAIADVFDALTSQRPYKPPFSLEKSLVIIKEGRGTHFDPDVADAFFAIEDEIASSLGFWQFLWAEPGEPKKDDKLP